MIKFSMQQKKIANLNKNMYIMMKLNKIIS